MEAKYFGAVVIALFAVSIIGTASASSLSETNEQLVQKYQNAKDAYLQAKNLYQNARQDWLTARERYISVRNETNTQLALDKARNYLTNAIDVAIKYLEGIEAKVNASAVLTDADKARITSEIDANIAWLRGKLSSIPNATKTELVSLTKDIKDKWKEIKPSAKKYVGEILAANINRIIDRMENLSARADAKIAELKANGTNTTALENWSADLKANIDLAKQRYEAAKAKFREITTVSDADKLFKEGHQFILEANQYLRQAHRDLVEIVKALAQEKIPASTVVAQNQSAENQSE